MYARTTGALLLCLGLGSWLPANAGTAQEISWHQGGLASAKAAAVGDDKDLLIYFWSETSAACASFFQNELQDRRVVDASRAFVCVSAQLEAGAGPLFERYYIQTTPTLLVVDPNDDNAQYGLVGSTNVPTIQHHLRRVARDEDTLRDLVRRAQADPKDMELRGELANRYLSLGQAETSAELRASIRTDDPKGKSAVAAKMYFGDKMRELYAPAAHQTEALVAELIAYVETIVPTDTQRDGWDEVARQQSALGNLDAEFEAWQRAYPLVRDTQLFNWGWSRSLWWWSNWDALSKKQRAFAIEVARRTVAVSERLSEEDPAYYDPGLFLTRRWNVLAMLLYKDGEKREATELMRRCVKNYPDSGEYKARLGVYEAGGDDTNFLGYSDYDANWSPDGKRVLFTSTRDGNAELYTCDVKRGRLTRVTRSLFDDDQGAFGPKGKTVAFRSNRFKTHAIYGAKLNGANCELLVPMGDDPMAPLSSGLPSYSKDGAALAFVQLSAGAPRVAVSAPDGTGAAVLGRPSEGEDSVDWASDGLVYSSTRDGKRDVFRSNADGSGERQLSPNDDAWEADVSASRDGERVVYAGWSDGQWSIFSMAADGSGLTQLTRDAGNDRRPRISPDGKRIVFDRENGGSSRLWIMDADGSDARPLVEPGR